MAYTECPECRYRFGLHRLPGLGRTRIRTLVERFGSAKAAWEATQAEWRAVDGFGARLAAAALAERSDARLERAIGALEARGIRLLCPEHFPLRLRESYDPPTLLYVKGAIEDRDARAVAVVGSRKATAHAIERAHALAASLATTGITVVSGLAAGVDAAAHQGALDAGGRTIAVMGSGLDRTYPPSHARLAADIARRGALVTEYPPGTEPHPAHFPMRNRLIAGWVMAVVVVEAPERSGALITARLALEADKDVLAVPGDAGRASCLGSNRLLQDGAGVALTADDVVSAIRMELESDGWCAPAHADATGLRGVGGHSQGRPASGSSGGWTPGDFEGKLLALLEEGGARHVEGLVNRSGRGAAEVQRALFRLEMAGLVRATASGEYVRAVGRARYSAGP